MSFVEIDKVGRDDVPADLSCCRKRERKDPIDPPGYFKWKGILDRALAMVMLIPGIPLIGLSSLLMRLTSKGPGIYSQTRVGKDGRIFTMHKIRTMRVDAEAETGPVWTSEDDDRITPVGRFLRRTHLDEFPQLFDVLRGEMSLIGPRPERPEFVAFLSKEIPGYLDRVAVKPGVTGLAQINLAPDVDLESVRRKLVLDTEYIKLATLFFDVRVVLCTSLHLLGCNAEWAKRVTRLHRDVPRLSVCASSGEDALAPAAAVPPTPKSLSLQIPGRNGGKNGSRSGDRASALRSQANTVVDTTVDTTVDTAVDTAETIAPRPR